MDPETGAPPAGRHPRGGAVQNTDDLILQGIRAGGKALGDEPAPILKLERLRLLKRCHDTDEVTS
jgi:hypothetical protein